MSRIEMPGQRGFTLIELITIMVIIGILAVVAIPRLGSENTFRERGFRDGLVSTLGHARRLAVAGRHFVCVNVSGSTGVVSLSRDANAPESAANINCGVALPLPGQPSGCAAGQLCTPSGVTLNGGLDTVLYYDPLGRLVQQAAPRSILAANPSIAVSGGQAAVSVIAATGYAQ